jgi:hypothetical protein
VSNTSHRKEMTCGRTDAQRVTGKMLSVTSSGLLQVVDDVVFCESGGCSIVDVLEGFPDDLLSRLHRERCFMTKEAVQRWHTLGRCGCLHGVFHSSER